MSKFGVKAAIPLMILALAVSNAFGSECRNSIIGTGLIDAPVVQLVPLKMKSDYIDRDAKNNVLYLKDENARKPFEIFINSQGNFIQPNGVPVDTRLAVNPDGVPKMAILVMDLQGRFFLSQFAQRGRFHHSSFFAGGDIAWAGLVEIEKGELKGTFNRTGHYDIQDVHDEQFLEMLKTKKAVKANTVIKFFSNVHEYRKFEKQAK